MRISTILAAILLIGPAAAADEVIWLETERFDDRGGWALDTQFIDQMGSPYLLANGLGKPVEDAVTAVTLPAAGRYRLWARTRDWVPEHHPGRFQIVVNGKTIEPAFGQNGKTGWQWEDGGVHPLSGKVEIRLHDLSGYYGRCDAIMLTDDLDFTPPVEKDAIALLREKHGGISRQIKDMPDHDVVVVGGGLAGCMAAVAAARNGASTALIQNRPVLGGNGSVEILVPPVGGGGKIRESGLIEEVRTPGNQRAAETWVYSGRLKRFVELEPNLDLHLCTHATGVEMKDGANSRAVVPTAAKREIAKREIAAVLAVDTKSGRRMRFPGKIFIDCTGDGMIGVWAGAEHRHGREAKDVYEEPIAPEKGNRYTMGNSLKYVPRATDSPKPFATPPWAFHFPKCSDFRQARHPSLRSGLDWQWRIEFGGMRDTYHDAEEIRDDLLRIIYGMWDHTKNRCPAQKQAAANYELAWVGYIAGKRESNRLIGDYVMIEQDVTGQKLFADRIAYGAWGLDDHHPGGFFHKGPPSGHPYKGRLHSVPYRTIYSKNINNLLMAGRNISVSHVALGTTRVMLTCAVIGHAAGTAGGLCVEKTTSPRGVYKSHLEELQQRLLKEGAYLVSLPNRDPRDLARKAKVSASSENDKEPAANVTNGLTRPEKDKSNAWRPKPGAAPPHWVCLEWDKSQTFNVVHLTQLGKCPAVVEARLDNEWKPIAEVPDARLRRNVLGFDPVTTTRLRVVLSGPQAVNEIRVYNEPQRVVDIARRAFENVRLPDTGPGMPWWTEIPPAQKPSPRRGAPPKPGLDPKKLPGVVIDAKQAELVGAWTPSTHTGPYIGNGYLTDDNTAKGSKAIRFHPKLSKPGKYEIRLAYSALQNRASNTPVTVRHAGGAKTVQIDQRRKAPVDGLLFPLGTFDLDEKSVIEVTTGGTDGYVVIDALQLLPVK